MPERKNDKALAVMMRKIDMADPYFNADDRERIHREIDNILDNSLSMGPNVKAFENEFATRLNLKYAIAMNSCTSTLEAALAAYNILGSEVIVPSETYIATGMAVHLSGGLPVFAEVSEKTLCLDIDDVVKRITSKTKGIILVHMAGLITPNIMEFRELCDDRKLFLIEDAAHAPGAQINKKEAGTFGHVGCFSFFPTKVITSGEGGMLVTDDDEIAAFARSFQNRGLDLNAEKEAYLIPGRNVRMTEMAALLGRIQFERLDEFLYRRRQIAQIYSKELSELDTLQLIIPKDIKSSSFWKIPILLNRLVDRSEVIDYLLRYKISTDCAYDPSLHLQPVFKNLYGTSEGQLPHSENYLSRNLNLPCHPRLTDNDILFVCDKLKEILK